ncbi:MAG: serine hydrolase domain-containing protein [Pseudomonadota bacterium]
MRTLIVGALMALSPALVSAQSLAQTTADTLRASVGSPGIVVAYHMDGVDDLAVSGLRRRGDPTPVGEHDLWHIGSITKSMTALLVARLAEAGRISWDDSIGTILGADVPDMHPGFAPVTYLDLLGHRAGVVANAPVELTRQLAAGTQTPTEDRLEYASAVLTQAPEEDAFSYSNAGYVVVGAMLEASTGQPWELLMREGVFEPLDLTSAGFGAPGTAEALTQPRGHIRRWGRLRPVEPGPGADNIAALGPAGTVHMNAADLLKYLKVHMSRPPDVLRSENWDRLHTAPAGMDYAAGWVRMNGGGLVHTGSNTMWYMMVVLRPQEGQALVIAANSGDASTLDPAFADAARNLLLKQDIP